MLYSSHIDCTFFLIIDYKQFVIRKIKIVLNNLDKKEVKVNLNAFNSIRYH